MDPGQLIANLNAIGIGDLDGVLIKLREAKSGCGELEQAELVQLLDEAESALREADLKTFRKRLETVVARLGHLK
ncbi:MAG TPA: hypothetical protein VJS92_09095 [Candidatus Polarisedimenticolaceae bacterium]|nr:hypothetical protein [Candidatus Polarisedimenticolaceae bacterium]